MKQLEVIKNSDILEVTTVATKELIEKGEVIVTKNFNGKSINILLGYENGLVIDKGGLCALLGYDKVLLRF